MRVGRSHRWAAGAVRGRRRTPWRAHRTHGRWFMIKPPPPPSERRNKMQTKTNAKKRLKKSKKAQKCEKMHLLYRRPPPPCSLGLSCTMATLQPSAGFLLLALPSCAIVFIWASPKIPVFCPSPSFQRSQDCDGPSIWEPLSLLAKKNTPPTKPSSFLHNITLHDLGPTGAVVPTVNKMQQP